MTDNVGADGDAVDPFDAAAIEAFETAGFQPTVTTAEPLATATFNLVLASTMVITIVALIISLVLALDGTTNSRAENLYTVCTHLATTGAGSIFGLLAGKLAHT